MLSILSLVLAGEWARQPIDPKILTDVTAYTIDKRDWRVGLVNVDYGLLDNLQIGTTVWTWALGAPNIHGKVTGVETKFFDVSFESGYTYRVIPNIPAGHVTLVPLKLTGSFLISKRLGVHLGPSWLSVTAGGDMGVGDVAGIVGPLLGINLQDELQQQVGTALDEAGDVYIESKFSLSQFRFATDFRLNRRDTLLFTLVNYQKIDGRVEAGYENKGGKSALTGGGVTARVEQPLDLLGTAMSVSWQFSYQRFHFRVGIPLAKPEALPLVLPNAFDIYWVF